MGDTVRIHREPDYFPLIEGYALCYRVTCTEFEEVETVEVTIRNVRAFREEAAAEAVLTRTRMGSSRVQRSEIRRTRQQLLLNGGVLGASRAEFPIPAVCGKQWMEGADRSEVASVDAPMEVTAGRFSRCLRVNTFLDGGAGTAIRYYAPGIGYLYEERLERSRGWRVSLLSYRLSR